jgi:hypothetical protein
MIASRYLDAQEGSDGMPVPEICRTAAISHDLLQQATGLTRLAADIRLKQLEDNTKLTKVTAHLSLDKEISATS